MTNYSPFVHFSRKDWAKLRANTPLTLTEEDVKNLRSEDEPVDLLEVQEVYLPLSRHLSMFATARARFHEDLANFMNRAPALDKVPWVIAIAGSVSVGKSTTARLLTALLSQWPTTPNVELVTTDGFLKPNEQLEELGITDKKGFPESYDQAALLKFVQDIKSAKDEVTAPVYSHKVYDIIPGEKRVVRRPDIVILEGLNVLQPASHRKDGGLAVSDYIDFSIYVDAEEDLLQDWFLTRFERHLNLAVDDEESYFRQWALMDRSEVMEIAKDVWNNINLVNLQENIGPTKQRASLVLTKGKDHKVTDVLVRKI